MCLFEKCIKFSNRLLSRDLDLDLDLDLGGGGGGGGAGEPRRYILRRRSSYACTDDDGDGEDSLTGEIRLLERSSDFE